MKIRLKTGNSPCFIPSGPYAGEWIPGKEVEIKDGLGLSLLALDKRWEQVPAPNQPTPVSQIATTSNSNSSSISVVPDAQPIQSSSTSSVSTTSSLASTSPTVATPSSSAAK